MTTNKFLKQTSENFEALLRQVLHSPCLLNQEFLQKKSWCAVPIEQAGYTSWRELERLLVALTDLKANSCIVVFPSDADSEPQGAKFEVCFDALVEAVSVPAFSYLITNEELEFVVHSTNEDFDLIGGSETFVKTAVGSSVLAARHDWREFATHPAQPEREMYQHVANWYDDTKDGGE